MEITNKQREKMDRLIATMILNGHFATAKSAIIKFASTEKKALLFAGLKMAEYEHKRQFIERHKIFPELYSDYNINYEIEGWVTKIDYWFCFIYA